MGTTFMLFSINNKPGFAFKIFLLRIVSPEANTRVAEKTKSSTMEEETEQISLVIHSLLKIIFDTHRIRRTNTYVKLLRCNPAGWRLLTIACFVH